MSRVKHDATPVARERSTSGQLFVVAVLGLLLAALLVLGFGAAKWKKGVVVRQVVIEGNRLVPDDELMRLVADLPEALLKDVLPAQIERRFLARPYIRAAEVDTGLDGTVRITVSEREPIAWLAGEDDRKRVLDSDGKSLPYRAFAVPERRFVTVHDLGDRFAVAKEFLQALEEMKYARLMVTDIWLNADNLTYFTVAGSETRFVVGNDGEYKEKFKKFEIFWQKVIAREGLDRYAIVDLRFHERVFAREEKRR